MFLTLKMMKTLITKQIIQLHKTTIINLIIKNLELKYTNKKLSNYLIHFICCIIIT